MKQAVLASLFLFALLLSAHPAGANDSTAETATGGLVLTRSDSIDMLSEDLYVSMDEVRVRYVFRNRDAEDIRTLVAFPMPVHDLSEERYGDVAFPSGFETRVDGAPVEMQVERRARLGDADHSALLTSLGVPLSPGEDYLSLVAALDALDLADQARLAELGLVEIDEYDAGRGVERHLAPMWRVEENWYWEQHFPAGRDLVVEHRYRPGVGGSVDVSLALPEFRESDYGRQTIADYCVDANFLAGLDRMRSSGRYLALTERRLAYILTTGGNWRAPIGDFRLVVDKGAPENIVSFCGEGVRKISPTQFEMRHRNWRPERDLSVLIVVPYAGE
ncbi:MAG: DUF4424 domain-containing protein [Parasphingopyxis sp.]|uniref:DUF4424 domain-containing protein n=1 Tax=Parasphingopyxis sp. TaxID=1920299 RepID=UPI003F9ED03E